jgi:hypothetical protein
MTGLMTLDDGALFAVEPVPPLRRVAPSVASLAALLGLLAWSRYTGKTPVSCDDCVQVIADDLDVAPPARQARWRRVGQGGKPPEG